MFRGKLCLVGQIYSFLFIIVNGYRLNVPRVLLPYHPEIQVSFELVVTDPEGGCFKWQVRSTRQDVVAVKMINGRDGCSEKALIYATSKHANEQTAMVFAEDKDSGVVLSCGIAVDIIKDIVITTTTKVLFLDAGPSQMVIHALNSEGDTFSNLGAIPFEWQLLSNSSKRPLRIVPFAQSKYEAPDGVRTLEERKKRGYIVLVEGVHTGTATLQAMPVEPFFKDVSAHEIVLLVVANLLLVPSCDLYLPVGSSVQYFAQIVKQGTTEPILLPSKQYHLELADPTVCSLSEDLSVVTALSLGTTELFLIDRNVKANLALKPPSVHIYVVEPSAISFAISGDSWYLEVGRHYVIMIQAYDLKDNLLYISDSAKFDTRIPEEYFKVLKKTKNESYIEVEALKSGVVRLRSKFVYVRMPDGNENKFAPTLSGEQMITISEQVRIIPELVVLPYIDDKVRHRSHLEAIGGTGVFTWAVEDHSIVHVDPKGLVTSVSIGTTRVIVKDSRNPLHSAFTVVRVLPPIKIAFAESPFEATVGSPLRLGVKMFVEVGGKMAHVSVCDEVKFSISVSDVMIFEIFEEKDRLSALPDTACTSFSLRALTSGDTTVTVTLGRSSALAHISAFNPLRLILAEEVLLTTGSETAINYLGGPRPWILDQSKFFAKFDYSDAVNLIRHDYSKKQLRLACNEAVGDIRVRLHVGNHKSQTNPLPVTSVAEFRVCCAVPSRLEINIESSLKKDGEKCPKNSQVLYMKESSIISLKAFGACGSGPSAGVERSFDSISAMLVDWNTENAAILKMEKFEADNAFEKSFAIARPYGLPGTCKVLARSNSFVSNGKKRKFPVQLKASLNLVLLDRARIKPRQIVLWNEKTNMKKIEVVAGSGHFDLLPGYDDSILNVVVDRSIIGITPLRTGKTTVLLVDLCFGNQFATDVTVTDLESITIEAPKYLEIHGEVPLVLKVHGAEGVIFSVDDVASMDVKIESVLEVLSVTRVDSLHYRLFGKSVGTSTVRASARSATGEVLHSLPHEIQVFAPLVMLPKVVTLIPLSVFQFEIIGGPQPSPSVSFALNDSAVVSIDSEGLICSKKLGFTSVVGSLSLDSGFSKDSAVIRVVSLTGIKIVVSSSTLDTNGKAWARVEGLGDGETPFSFGGALHPLHITWSLGSHGIVEMSSSLGASVFESLDNQFQVSLKGLSAGQTELKVSVTINAEAPVYTASSRSFSDHVIITVSNPLELVQPFVKPTSLIISPGSRIELESNKPNVSVHFDVLQQFEKIISLSGGDRPLLHGHEIGEAVIKLQHHSNLLNRTALIPVSVVMPHSIFLELADSVPLSGDGLVLTALPVGFRVTLLSGVRDHFGRLLHASGVKILFRPHRFDLTVISSKVGQQFVDVHLKQIGETTLMVWDEKNPAVNAFIRIPVSSVITPASTSVLLSDIICFKSVLAHAKWAELVSRKRLEVIDDDTGVFVARELGNTVIGAIFSYNQSTFAELTIVGPEELVFGDVPKFITNIGKECYVFPVFLKGPTGSINARGCDLRDLEKFSGLAAPFDCSISFEKESSVSAAKVFSTRAEFSSVSNSYACILEKAIADHNSAFMRGTEGKLVVKASSKLLGKEYKVEAYTQFYPRFEVEQAELRLDSKQSSEGFITIRASDSVSSSITVDSCKGDVLYVRKQKSNLPQTVTYTIKLNVNSALLWREFLGQCNLVVRSTLTGQVEEIVVKIALTSDAAEALKLASESSINRLYQKVASYMTLLGTLIATGLTLFALFAWYKGYSILPSLFAPVYRPQPGAIGVFASERISAGPGYVSPVRYLKHSPGFASGDRCSSPIAYIPDLSMKDSSRYSTLNRSAGSAGDSFLWSKDGARTSPKMRVKTH